MEKELCLLQEEIIPLFIDLSELRAIASDEDFSVAQKGMFLVMLHVMDFLCISAIIHRWHL